MLDPLRSLAELVRTLTRSRTNSRGGASETRRQSVAGDQQPIQDLPPAAVSAVDALRERLRKKLRVVGTKDARRAREAFVETVLASELGDAVILDPQMNEIVGKIAQQLGQDAATNRDLALLFDDLAR
jgi:hypothetical protein